MEISAVIITKNEAHCIAECISSLKACCGQIVVLDSNSSDNTVAIAKALGAEVVNIEWKGYGATKNLGNAMAIYPWILSLDADEVLDLKLIEYIKNWNPQKPKDVLNMARHMVWQKKVLRFGQSKEIKTRLFNRQNVSWDNSLVHEQLQFIETPKYYKASGKILHSSYKNRMHAAELTNKYALYAANQKFKKHQRTNALMPYLQYLFVFIRNYFLLLGFLDGKAGPILATIQANYAKDKYAYLYELQTTKT